VSRVSHPPLPPTPESVALLRQRHDRARPYIAALLRRAGLLTSEGHEAIPREGPLLLLANHVEFPDAITMNVVAGRAVVVMGTEALAQGAAGRLILAYGLSPKKKNMPDSKAVRLLKSWVDAGAAVGVFPEGERTWDGRPLPLISGIEKLVLLLGVPVVTMRIYNGYRQWPRWAPQPRWARVHVVVDPPVTFSKSQGIPAIAAELARRLRVDDREGPSFPVHGFNLASGVTNLLYACPSCGRIEGLEERGSEVRCRACRDRWRVTGESTLVGPGGERTLADVVDLIRARLSQEGWHDKSLEGDALLRSEPCTILDETNEQPATVGSGRMVLTPQAIHLEGEVPWKIPLSELVTANVENRRRFWLRTRDGRLYEPILPSESVVKWEHLTTRWRQEATSTNTEATHH